MSDTRMHDKLRRMNRRIIITESFSTMLRALATVIVFFMVAVAIDIMIGLPTWGLVIADLVLGGVVIFGFCWLVGVYRRYRFEPKRAARLLEERSALRRNELINAVEFAGKQDESSLVSIVLNEGEVSAGQIKANQVVDSIGIRKALTGFLVAVSVLVGTWMLAPQLFATVLPRLLSPVGDRPAFSLTEFEVKVEPELISYGGTARVHAVITSHVSVKDAWLVFERNDDEGVGAGKAAGNKTYMLRDPDGGFMLDLKGVKSSKRFYVACDQGRSEWVDLNVDMRPRFEQVFAKYTFPEYTQWPNANYELDGSAIQALVGSKVNLQVVSNVPLNGGELELSTDDGKVLKLGIEVDPTNEKMGLVSFNMRVDGKVKMWLRGKLGEKSEKPWVSELKALADQAPKVRLVKPDAEVVVPENWKVDVRYQATDDIGVTRMVMHRTVNGWGPSSVELSPSFAIGRTNAEAVYTFDLKALGARGGDVITYFATGYDNHPGGAQSGDSVMGYIYVITEEEYKALERSEYNLESLSKEIDSLIDELNKIDDAQQKIAEDLEKLEKKLEAQGGEMSPEDKKALEDLKQKMNELADRKARLAEQMEKRAEQPPLYDDLEKDYQKKLKEMAEEMKKQAEELKKSAEKMQGKRPLPSIKDAKEKLQGEGEQSPQEQFREELEENQQDLKILEQANKMIEQLERIANVVTMQKELADKMSPFKQKLNLNATDLETLKRHSELQQALRDELNDATAELEHLARESKADLPTMSESAIDIVGQIRQKNVSGDQRDAANFAHDGMGKDSQAKARSAADKLNEVIESNSFKQGEGSGESGMSDLDGKLGFNREQMKNLMNQLSQGRKMPGFGQKPGQGLGNGQGVGSSQGNGMRSGSRRMSMLGPEQRSAQRDGPRNSSGRTFGNQPGYGSHGTGEGVGSGGLNAERMQLDAMRERSKARGMTGVSSKYRNLAELYFRRLNEGDNK